MGNERALKKIYSARDSLVHSRYQIRPVMRKRKGKKLLFQVYVVNGENNRAEYRSRIDCKYVD